MDDGTGLVHTAPGHGAEDYATGLKYGLPTLSPVDAGGRFTAEAPEFVGGWGSSRPIPKIVERLKGDGSLYHEVQLEHSYPHCWRCKRPVIFRATEQWFIKVDHEGLRERTLQAIDQVTWIPALGAGADRGDGAKPAGLVHQPAAVVGRADPGVCVQRRATRCC